MFLDFYHGLLGEGHVEQCCRLRTSEIVLFPPRRLDALEVRVVMPRKSTDIDDVTTIRGVLRYVRRAIGSIYGNTLPVIGRDSISAGLSRRRLILPVVRADTRRGRHPTLATWIDIA